MLAGNGDVANFCGALLASVPFWDMADSLFTSITRNNDCINRKKYIQFYCKLPYIHCSIHDTVCKKRKD